MSNGDSPVPKWPEYIFENVTAWTYDSATGGYKETAQSDPSFLYVMAAGSDGEVEWNMATTVPGWAVACCVSSDDNAILQAGELDNNGFDITSAGKDYKAHANPGAGEMCLEEY